MHCKITEQPAGFFSLAFLNNTSILQLLLHNVKKNCLHAFKMWYTIIRRIYLAYDRTEWIFDISIIGSIFI